MMVIPPIDALASGVLVATNAADEAAYAAGTTYAQGAVVSYNKRKYQSLQGGNTGHTPNAFATWWLDAGPSNQWAMFDASASTTTVQAGGLSVTLKTGRVGAVVLMGVKGDSVTITVRDGLNGAAIDSRTRVLTTTDGSFYGWCFFDFYQQSDVLFTDLAGAFDGYITIAIASTGQAACGVCVVGTPFDIGQAQWGFSVSTEDRGRQYLDDLGNPVTIERGYSKGASGTVAARRADFNRLNAFFADNLALPCVWVASPDQADLVSATVLGRFTRAVVAIQDPVYVTSSLEISGYR
jgi:hypothetical protein